MKTGFKDPIAKKPTQSRKSPWNATQPEYDERSSCYVNMGTRQGVGYNNPVGSEAPAKQRVETLPFGRPKTLELYPEPSQPIHQDYVE